MAGKTKGVVTPQINYDANKESSLVGLGLTYNKNDTDFYVDLDKIFSKNSEKQSDDRISAGVFHNTDKLTYGFNVHKQGEDRGVNAGFNLRFNTGGEVEIGKVEDYIKDLL